MTQVTAICADADRRRRVRCRRAPRRQSRQGEAQDRRASSRRPATTRSAFKGEMTIPTVPDARSGRERRDRPGRRRRADASSSTSSRAGRRVRCRSPRIGWKARRLATPRGPTRTPSACSASRRSSVKRDRRAAPASCKFAVKGKNGAFDSIGAALPVHGASSRSVAAGQGGLATFTGPAPRVRATLRRQGHAQLQVRRRCSRRIGGGSPARARH